MGWSVGPKGISEIGSAVQIARPARELQISDFLCVIGVVTRLLEHPTLRISQVSILVLAPLATLRSK